MAKILIKRLARDVMVKYVHNVIDEDAVGYTEDQLNRQLWAFCMNCPDPLAAYRIVIETWEPYTAEEMVEMALAMPRRDMADVPESELPSDHFFRNMQLEP